MISAVVLINVQRNQINETAQSLLDLMAFQCYSKADLQQAWDIGVE